MMNKSRISCTSYIQTQNIRPRNKVMIQIKQVARGCVYVTIFLYQVMFKDLFL